MNTRFLIPLGVIAFAVTLAIVLRDSVSGEARLLVTGIALGLIIGVPVGMISMLLAGRARRSEIPPASPLGGISLSPEQTELLFKAIERQQALPQDFGLTPRQSRTFSAVGGAALPDSTSDGEDQI